MSEKLEFELSKNIIVLNSFLNFTHVTDLYFFIPCLINFFFQQIVSRKNNKIFKWKLLLIKLEKFFNTI